MILLILLSEAAPIRFILSAIGDNEILIRGHKFKKIQDHFNSFYDWIIDDRSGGLILLGVRCNFLIEDMLEFFAYLSKLPYIDRRAKFSFEIFFFSDKSYKDNEYSGEQLFIDNYIYFNEELNQYAMTFEISPYANQAILNTPMWDMDLNAPPAS